MTWTRRSALNTLLGLTAAKSRFSHLLAAASERTSQFVEASLETQEQWLNVAGGNAYLYAFNGQIPGPVVEAQVGDRVRIQLRNSLPEPTNLHYHGLHVPPAGSADNSFLTIPPAESFTYEFDLPATHLGGTFWYHPHIHGSAARQVSRGLAGVFVVRGELDQIPEIAAAPESIIVLQDFDLNANGVPQEPNMMERIAGREGALVTVNAQLNPTIPIQRAGWLRLRILNASASRFYRVRLEEHPLYLIAVDAGALPSPDEREEVLLAPGERAEVMIRGARPEGSYRLFMLPYSRGGMGMGTVADIASSAAGPFALATLLYQGEAEQTWDLPQQLVTVDPLPEPIVRRSFQLGQRMGMTGGGTSFTINGRTFNSNRVDTQVQLNAVEEWEFVNSTMMDHPMHIHTNPFQVIATDGTPIRAWKDVVLVGAGMRVKVRMAFRNFSGSSMYHCHILDHEDLGMMGRLEIQE